MAVFTYFSNNYNWWEMAHDKLKPWSNGVASSHKWRKLNLPRDLRWVAKRTGKFLLKWRESQKKKKGRHILYFIG